MRTTNVTGQAVSVDVAHRAPVRWPWPLIAVAWGIALLAILTDRQELIHHEYLLERSGLPFLMALTVFLIGWQVMTLGMMLPSSLPIVNQMTYAARAHTHTRTVLAVFLAGYAAVWTAFALVAFTGDALVHQAVDSSPWLTAHSYLIGATTFALAGVFQFSPVKERCLTACHNPLAFVERHYRAGVAPAWRLGLRHGLLCLGSCWTLMLVMFGVGMGNLLWMVLLVGVMVIEKAVPGGRRIRPLVGIALLALAVIWLLHPAGIVPSAVA